MQLIGGILYGKNEYVQLKEEVMNVAAPVEKEKKIQQTEQKKKQKQVEPLPLPSYETENANAQKPDAPIKGASDGNSTGLSNHNGIPAVHGAQPAYVEGSESMHKQLQASLTQTGDLNHPDTQQKEMDYKKTLGISDLRDYNDIKTGTYVPKTPAEQVAVTTTTVKKEETITSKTAEVAASTAIVENDDSHDFKEIPTEQSPIEAKQDIPPVSASNAKQEKIPLQNTSPKIEPPKVIKANKEAKIVNKGNPNDLLANLSNTPATELASRFNATQVESTTVLNNQNKEAASRLPKLNAAQGSAFNKSKAKKNLNSEKAITKTSKKTVKASSPKTALKETSFPEKAPLKKENNTFQSSDNKKVAVDKQAQNQLDSVRLNTATIPTKLQQNTNLDLSGEASVDHLSIEQNDASQDMSIKKSHAVKDIHKDHGENDIIKAPINEILTTNHKFKTRNTKIKPIKGIKSEELDETAINSNFEPIVQSKIGAEQSKYEAAQLEHDQKVLSEENTAGAKIETEKSKSKEKQLKSVREAQGDVNKSRTEWQNQLNKTETDFAKKAGDQAKTTMGKIQTEKTAGESKAQDHINKANQDAQKKKQVADKEAEQKKSEKKKESSGFFGWVADKASAFINALKDALNFIFTKLREAVKAIFDFAKKLVLAALEFARKAIISFIKGFASLLKGFLDIALAAFPALRDRLKAKIDQYVAVAEKYVNQAFDQFKKIVTAIIDFLASAVDALLGALQAIYNFILDAINFIVAGIIKIIEFLFNLNVAAALSVFEFFGALAEEALGGNPANPIPDIEVPLGQEKPWAVAMGLETETETETETQIVQNGKESIGAAIPLLTKSKLEDNDVTLEPYPAITMDNDFLRSLPNLKEGEQLELGGAGENSITTKQFQEAAAFEAGLSIQEEKQTPNKALENENLEAQTEKAPTPDWRHMDDEAKLNVYNNQMLDESEKTGSAEPSQEKATPAPTDDNSPEALVTKTGRLGVGRRLQFMGEQMLTGIKAFWNKYKGWIIAGLIAALVIIAAILFFSGGTALGIVVQAIGEALILIFGAIAVTRAMGSIWDYVKKAWAGDTKGAAKALATAFAIIVVEFFIDKILMGMGKVFKRILKTFKATKVGKFIRRAIIVVKKAERGAGNLIKQGISKIRGTKLVITLEKFVAKGANKLDDLRNKILTKFGFKRIWLEKHGRHIQMWGEFNAKVLLFEEDVDGNRTYRIDEIDDAGKVGSRHGTNGIVLDDIGNDFSRNADDLLKKGDQKALKEMHNELDKLNDVKRADKIRGGTKSERVPLRKKIADEIWENADTGRTEIINGKECKIYRDGKTKLDIPNYGTHYPEKTPLGRPHSKAGEPVPENLIGKPRADIGHKNGQKWEERLKQHKKDGLTREQIIEAENKSELYVIEERSSNRSRRLD